jgi:hypothetical protein
VFGDLRVVLVASLLLVAASLECGADMGSSAGVGAAPVVARRASALGAMAGDALRTGWYPNQPLLDPQAVGSPAFGSLFSVDVEGQVYAQPLVAAGTLLIATEANWVYGLDPATGATLWSRSLGPPWNAADLNCYDLEPTIGVTGTPAIDESTGTAYLLAKTYLTGNPGTGAWYAHALALADGVERPGFPILIAGTAANEPAQSFDATYQMQRPGLLLMAGVVYAAFGAHCDRGAYAGWIVGFSTEGSISTLWTTEAGASKTAGGGIWQAGGGLMSDGPGQILFATGNDHFAFPDPIAGSSPPGALGEAVVRVTVQPDLSLRAVDFFAPMEAGQLNAGDADLGAGAPLALPAGLCGTSTHPNLLVETGKSGYVYLLDRDHLGGFAQGISRTDDALQRLGPFGGVWSKPSTWPGDGGYVYIPTSSGCTGPTDPSGCLTAYRCSTAADGRPALALAARSDDFFGYGSSAAVITSNGVEAGSALVWTTWSSGWYGNDAQLRAYDAVPSGGAFALRFIATIGQSSKYALPGVGDARIYVGTRDGHVLAFGVQPPSSVRASGLAFGPALPGDSVAGTVHLAGLATVALVGLDASGDFALDAPLPSLPRRLSATDDLVVPVTFTPSVEGPALGQLMLSTDRGPLSVPLAGVGESGAQRVRMNPEVLAFGETDRGDGVVQTLDVTNIGDMPVLISNIVMPDPPFGIEDPPAPGSEILTGGTLSMNVLFNPSARGGYASTLSVVTDDDIASVALEGMALEPGRLRVVPGTLDLGSVSLGQTVTTLFQLTDVGDTPITVSGATIPDGTTLGPGESVVQNVRVSPVDAGPGQRVWQVTAGDEQITHPVTITVTGVVPKATTNTNDGSPPDSGQPDRGPPDGGPPDGAPPDGAQEQQVAGAAPSFGVVMHQRGGCEVAGASTSDLDLLSSLLIVLGLFRQRRSRQ